MHSYTVHIKPAASSPEQQVIFVKDSFSVPALIFGFFWMLYHRMWIVALGLLAALLLLVWAANAGVLNEVEISILNYGLNLLIAFQAADLRAWNLKMSGYQMVAVITAANQDEAEIRFFNEWPGELPPLPRSNGSKPAPFSKHLVGKPVEKGLWPRRSSPKAVGSDQGPAVSN